MSTADEATKLKLRALELKRAGDVEGAKALLARAREIEFADVTADQLDSPADLKRLAVALKKKGDIAGAREALIKAKRLEAGGGGGGGDAAASTDENKQQQRPTPAQQLSSRVPCLYTSTKSVGKHDAAAAAAEKDDKGDGNDDDACSVTGIDDTGAVTFTDEEMIDAETMCEMKMMGMDVPTEEDYKARIMACKKKALDHKKRGDIAAAKAELIKAKQLDAVMTKLYNDDDDEEDYSLLDELNDDGDDGAFFEELFGDDGNTLDLDDLDHLDATMLRDMMEAGMVIPEVEDVMRSAQEKKELAVALHKDGNAAGAKAALAESKRLQGRAETLAEMLEAIESGGLDGEDGSMEALEAMLAAEDGGSSDAAAAKGGKSRPSKQGGGAAASRAEEPTKSAEEYKQDAIRLKAENKLAEASAALKMYKKALAAESNAAEMERRREVVAELRDEMSLAEEQERLFTFYERFVDQSVGNAQLSFWKKYRRDCATASKVVETKGSSVIDIMRSSKGAAMRIHDEGDLGFVGRTIEPTEERLEVAVLDVLGVSENKHLKKALRQKERDQKKGAASKEGSAVSNTPPIRVDVTIQLPPNEKEVEGNIALTYEPTICGEDDGRSEGCYKFGPSQHVGIPRGTSRHAKTILRRMSRKRIQITVYYVPPRKKGLFGRNNSATSKMETSLGTVVLELKDLLTSNFIAGDFPLMDSTRRNELGGTVRLGLRTGTPYDPEEGEVSRTLGEMMPKNLDVKQYESMSFLSSSSGTGFD